MSKRKDEMQEEKISEILSSNNDISKLVSSPCKAYILPLPERSGEGDFVLIWACLKYEDVTYENILFLCKKIVNTINTGDLLTGIKAIQINPSLNSEDGKHLDKIVSITVLDGKYDEFQELKTEDVRKEIDQPPAVEGFQEIPEVALREGVFCKWYWDNNGEKPKRRF